MTKHILHTAFSALLLAAAIAPSEADACTRIVYQGNDSLYIVGRSLDWKTPIPTNIYVYPRGMEKKGSDKPGAVSWTSRYGAVYAVGYDGGVTEGLNEKGLSVNGLFCKGTVYENDSTSGRPAMSLAMFPAWLLDMHATTAECVATIRAHKFSLSGADFDNGTGATLHWGITDAGGNSAIVEFDHGTIRIHEGKELVAMTNDPQWDDMEAILAYWEKIGGTHALPGTVSSPDRCVRAKFFVTHVEKTADADLGAAIARSVIANCCVPYSYTIEGEPNISSTQWRSLSDVRERRYYFDLVTNPGMFYVDLDECDLRPGKPVLFLNPADCAGITGNATRELKPHEPFTPMF